MVPSSRRQAYARRRASGFPLGQKAKAILLAALVVIPPLPSSLLAMPSEDGWQILKGQHFILHVEEEDGFFGQKVLREAERLYDRISSSLGYLQRESWLWENRCLIYLYRDKNSYLEGTRRPAWSSAASTFHPVTGVNSDGLRPVIEGHRGSETFLETELPHEIAHLLFRKLVGVMNANIPLWLDEGIALWQEEVHASAPETRGDLLEGIIRDEAARGALIPFSDLTTVGEGTQLSAWARGQPVTLFYAESYSLVKFLVSRFGHARFVNFLRELREGEKPESSLAKTYGVYFQDLASLEREWQRSLDIARSS